MTEPQPQPPSPPVITPDIHHEIKEALWGCVEIPLFLKKGATRFTGTLGAFKRSFLIPALIIPLVVMTIPNPPEYVDRSTEWTLGYVGLGVLLSTIVYLIAMYFFRSKEVTNEQFLKFATGYNWLSLSGFVIQIPLMILAMLGVNTWDDVFAMMALTTLYSYGYLAYMITHTLKMDWYLGFAFAMLDLLVAETMYNISEYVMTHL
jgi:hypothetical protein